MKAGIFVFALSICLNSSLSAQSASDYLPTLNSTWTVESVSTLDDSIVSASIRTDSLYLMELLDGYMVYSITTSEEGYTYKLDTRDDTLFIRVVQVLQSEIFADGLLELDVDPEDRLPIAIFSAGVNDVWEVYHLEQTIELSDTLKEAFSGDINIDDEADIEITVTGIRLEEELILLPIGEITTQVFEIHVDLTLTVYALLFGYRIPVPLDLLEGYALRTYIANERGLVKQFADEYDVYATNDDYNVNEYVFTLPATSSIMIEFNEGDPTFVDSEEHSVPSQFTLRQNYPNPFNPVTTIIYTVPEQLHVSLSVYNILGARVETLVDDVRRAGSYRAVFDASDLPSGVYFYRLQAGGSTETKRMVLSK